MLKLSTCLALQKPVYTEQWMHAPAECSWYQSDQHQERKTFQIRHICRFAASRL